MADIDIKSLTADAEAGKGCSVADAVRVLPTLAEREDVMREIVQNNILAAKDNPTLPKLIMVGSGYEGVSNVAIMFRDGDEPLYVTNSKQGEKCQEIEADHNTVVSKRESGAHSW